MKLSTKRREELLPLLDNLGGLNSQTIAQTHQELDVPESDIWSTGSFYSLFKLPSPSLGICQGLSCKVNGSDDWAKSLEKDGWCTMSLSCLGQCDKAPAAIRKDKNSHIHPFYQNESPRSPIPRSEKLAINLNGPDDLNYAALNKIKTKKPKWVLEQLQSSGLQGRGGAGFSAHIKWDLVHNHTETERYLVCNADEGEPGTFKDRDIMLYRPHLLLEGLAIAAKTIAAKSIYIYIRGEFIEERKSLEKALKQAKSHLDTFDFQIVSGHGAYICGEETALLEALEGRRGMPRLKPPYPTDKGFRQKPTLINNVETLACVPSIINNGGSWFKNLGATEAGTKLYCISGHVQRPGTYELPLGSTLNQLVDAAEGYVGTPKAFSPGGASSGFLPMEFADTPLDFGSLAKLGTILGSAGVVVLNSTVNMVEAALIQSTFFEDESCGQCAPCRIGTQLVKRAILNFQSSPNPTTLDPIEIIDWEMEEGSICGLGMVAAKPLRMAMKYFPEEFTVPSSLQGSTLS